MSEWGEAKHKQTDDPAETGRTACRFAKNARRFFAFLENTVENIYKIYEKIYNVLVNMIGSESSCLKE